MNVSQVLEVAIGLTLVYYLLGSIVSWATRTLLEAQETRGKSLEEYLKKIAGPKTVDLTSLPQMKALQPIRYTNGINMLLGRPPQPKMIEKVPVPTLVDAFFDLSGLTGSQVDGEALKGHLSKLPASEGRDAMIKWVEQGVDTVNGLRTRASAYFDGLLDQAGNTFKTHARRTVILLSIFITLFFGTDSIQLAKDLWVNAELRAVAAAQADKIIQDGSGNLNLDTILAELDKLSIVKFGWWHIQDALPDTANTMDWLGFVGLKFLGLGITAAAVSQGSSFWYDLLKKLTSPSKSSSTSTSSGGGSSSSSSSESAG